MGRSPGASLPKLSVLLVIKLVEDSNSIVTLGLDVFAHLVEDSGETSNDWVLPCLVVVILSFTFLAVSSMSFSSFGAGNSRLTLTLFALGEHTEHALAGSLSLHLLSPLISLQLLDLVLVSIWIRDSSSDVLASHDSEEIVELGEVDVLGHGTSEFELLLEAESDLRANFLVIDGVHWVQLSHVVVDVLVDIKILDNHDDLSLSSALIEHIVDDIWGEYNLCLILEGQVEKNDLELVVLVQFLLGFLELCGVIESLKLFLSVLSKVHCLHRLEGLIVTTLSSHSSEST